MMDLSITFCNSRILPGHRRPATDPASSFRSSECSCPPGWRTVARILDEHQYIVFPFSQRRHFNRKHIKAIEEILAETSSGYRSLQIAIRRRDDTNVD